MLVLSRKREEKIRIVLDEEKLKELLSAPECIKDIVICVVSTGKHRASLGIDAPVQFRVMREEIL